MTRSHKQQGRPTLTRPALPVGPWSERRPLPPMLLMGEPAAARTACDRGRRGFRVLPAEAGSLHRRAPGTTTHAISSSTCPSRPQPGGRPARTRSGPRCPARWPVGTAPSCSIAEASCPRPGRVFSPTHGLPSAGPSWRRSSSPVGSALGLWRHPLCRSRWRVARGGRMRGVSAAARQPDAARRGSRLAGPARRFGYEEWSV